MSRQLWGAMAASLAAASTVLAASADLAASGLPDERSGGTLTQPPARAQRTSANASGCAQRAGPDIDTGHASSDWGPGGSTGGPGEEQGWPLSGPRSTAQRAPQGHRLPQVVPDRARVVDLRLPG